MKAGDKVKCPHCGEDTLVKEKNLMDGWKPLGKVLACAICGEKLGDAAAAAAETGSSSAALDSLKALLQAEEEAAPAIDLHDVEKRFCKDCVHFVPHPFINRCGLHDRPADPMGDCPQFTPKVKE